MHLCALPLRNLKNPATASSPQLLGNNNVSMSMKWLALPANQELDHGETVPQVGPSSDRSDLTSSQLDRVRVRLNNIEPPMIKVPTQRPVETPSSLDASPTDSAWVFDSASLTTFQSCCCRSSAVPGAVVDLDHEDATQ